MPSVQIEPPTTYGVTVQEAKAHSRVLGTADDSLVATYLASALDYAEAFIGRRYQPQTWEMTIDAFPSAEIQITPSPVVSITKIEYVDADGATQIVDDATFETDFAGDDAWVIPSEPWPAIMETVNAVKITFVAGRGNMPASLKQAIIMLAAHYYEDREGASFPEGVTRILLAHKRYFI